MFKSEWLKRQDILLSFVANSFAAKVLVIVNKIILFWFFFINSGPDNVKKTGGLWRTEEDGVENVWAKTLYHATYLIHISFIVMLCFVHSRFRFRVFLGLIASDSHSRIVGMDFFHTLPVPKCHSRSPLHQHHCCHHPLPRRRCQ